MGPFDSSITRTLLPGGVRVITERMPEALSATIGIYVGVGARDEPDELAGASHFLEHLLFKGTEDRSARELAQVVDAVGGEMNAYTAREHTAFYTRVPHRHLALGIDVLADVVARPALRPEDIDTERQVILEELLMSDDDPDDVVDAALWEAAFPDHPLGREVLGSADTVADMGRDQIAGFHERWYRPANLVVAAAGNLHHDAVVEPIAAFFEHLDPGVRPVRHRPRVPSVPVVVRHRATEQAHVAMSWSALDHDDDDRYALAVANHVLGGGPASRLFGEIRELRGLVYSVHSAPAAYSDCGVLVVGLGTAPARVPEVLELVRAVLDDLLAEGITADEQRVAQGYLEGSLLLGLEDSGSRMARLAHGEQVRGEVVPVDEHVARLRSVTRDDVSRVLHRVFDGPRTLAVVGPFEPDDPRLTP